MMFSPRYARLVLCHKLKQRGTVLLYVVGASQSMSAQFRLTQRHVLNQ
jgi:hypothetical protein